MIYFIHIKTGWKVVIHLTRTRFAMCPQKKMDIEDLRNALFSYLIAKKEDGEFILRIDDANQNLYSLEAEESIYTILSFFGLTYDEGPKKEVENVSYIQSERLPIYKSYAEKLVKRGKAYYCFCTKEELNRKRLEASEEKTSYLYDRVCRNFPKDEANRKILSGEKYVIRETMPEVGQTSFRDLVYGDITILNATLEDQILIKSDGTPTYNFANVLDDALFNITHVISSTKFLTSTPKYLLLYEDLGFPLPEFIHIPEILTDKKDILTDLLGQGFIPSAILNYIAFLGWNPKNTKEFFTLEELIKEFKIESIGKRPTHFDLKKLEWFNKKYIQNMNDTEYINYVRPFLEKFYNMEGKEESWIHHLLLLNKNRISFAAEIGLTAHMFFSSEVEYDEECIAFLKSDSSIQNTLRILKKEVETTENWNLETIKEILKHIEIEIGVTGKLLYMPIRIATTGIMRGPNLVDCLYLLGRDTILERLKN